jgi:hypothetical protein
MEVVNSNADQIVDVLRIKKLIEDLSWASGNKRRIELIKDYTNEVLYNSRKESA